MKLLHARLSGCNLWVCITWRETPFDLIKTQRSGSENETRESSLEYTVLLIMCQFMAYTGV